MTALKNNGLHINQLSFKFAHTQQPFFNTISLSFAPGQLHFIRGRNGSGKTTLFRILQGDMQPHEQIHALYILDGMEYQTNNSAPSTTYKHKVKQVVQQIQTMLVPQFSVLQNLQLACLAESPGLQKLPVLPIPSILMEFGITPHMMIDQLSGGQRQIVAILMILQKPTRVLLLDEPTAALDPENADLVMRFLQSLAREQGLVIIIISHDKELVELYAQQEYTEIVAQQDGSRLVISKKIEK